MFFIHVFILSLMMFAIKVNGLFTGGSLAILFLELVVLFFDLWFVWMTWILRKACLLINIKEREITYDDETDLGKRAIN